MTVDLEDDSCVVVQAPDLGQIEGQEVRKAERIQHLRGLPQVQQGSPGTPVLRDSQRKLEDFAPGLQIGHIYKKSLLVVAQLEVFHLALQPGCIFVIDRVPKSAGFFLREIQLLHDSVEESNMAESNLELLDTQVQQAIDGHEQDFYIRIRFADAHHLQADLLRFLLLY